jgi:hypothetical protein
MRRLVTLSAALVLAATTASTPVAAEQSRPQVGTTFPEGFAVPLDASSGAPVLGFGSSEGEVTRTPVVFLHGNNDTPYPTSCNEQYGKVRDFAQHLLDSGWSPKELWALGYQGDQCDLQTDQRRRAGEAQWMRQDDAHGVVRKLVGVDGPNHGIINCSPSPLNYYVTIGFTPDSPVCLEYGAADTPMLAQLNAGDETPGPTEYLAVVNADTSFVYIAKQDGVLAPVPAQDREGRPHDFSRSAYLEGATLREMTGQGQYDGVLLAAHTGIINSPDVWKASADFLAPSAAAPPAAPPAAPAGAPAGAPAPQVAAPRAALSVVPTLVSWTCSTKRTSRGCLWRPSRSALNAMSSSAVAAAPALRARKATTSSP